MQFTQLIIPQKQVIIPSARPTHCHTKHAYTHTNTKSKLVRAQQCVIGLVDDADEDGRATELLIACECPLIAEVLT